MATDLLAFALANRPESTAVVEGVRGLSFREVHHRANGLVGYFRSINLVPGDRVALLAKNEIQYLEIQVACMRAGLMLVPVNFRLAAAEIAYIVDDCDPSLVISGQEFVAQVPDTVRVLALNDSYEAMVSDMPDASMSLAPIDLGLDCTILYTSGTTGRPKGAVLTNAALFARINANVFEYAVSPDDVFLQCLPLFHIASNVSYTYAYCGATNILLKDFHPLGVLDQISIHRVTTALLVPTMINSLIHQPEIRQADLTSLKKVAYGASPIPPSVLSAAIDALGCEFLQLYGMTETSAATVLRPEHHDPEGHPELLVSAGQSALGMEARIVDDNHQELADGELGEIVCRGEALMRGYWQKEEASREVLRDGWMHTGDIGYRNTAGFFFVTDRKKDMIVSGGENIYPREVEDVLFEYPDVLEAAVIGIPDEKWGERVHAVLVAKPGKVIDTTDLTSFTRERLAGYKLPKSVELLDSLPKNATGKVLKNELRKKYWEGKGRSVS